VNWALDCVEPVAGPALTGGGAGLWCRGVERVGDSRVGRRFDLCLLQQDQGCAGRSQFAVRFAELCGKLVGISVALPVV